MHDHKPLDLSGLTVENVEVVPASSLDSAAYGHGMPELAASCFHPDRSECDCDHNDALFSAGASCFMPDQPVEV